MRPIPAPRLGDTHGLLRAINERERLRLDEFITEFSLEELFPPGLENALGRTRQFVSFARSAGLLKEDRGTVELTEVGKRYVRAGDENAIFDVAPDQAEWLRRQLRERHMTDSIYHGAAIGLSLYASNPADFHVSQLDFGRALAYLGRAGWDNENTLESQGERYTTFLRDLELVDEESRLTETGSQVKAELTLPIHMSLRDLAGQLNPGGPEGAQADGEAERAARGGAAAAPAEAAAAAEPAPTAEEPAPVPAAAAEGTGEYEDVRGSATAPAPAPTPTPAEPPAASERPVPPSDVWETAAPDEATRAYSAISPEEAAAMAAAAESEPEAPRAGATVSSGDPLAAAPEAEPEPEPVTPEPAAAGADPGDPLAGPPAAVEAGDPLAAGTAAPDAGQPPAEPSAAEAPAEAGAPAEAAPVEAGDPLAASEAAAPAPDVEAPSEEAPVEAGDPLAAGGIEAAGPEAPTPDAPDEAPPVEAGDPLAAGGVEAAGPEAPEAEAPPVEAGDPLAVGDAAPPPVEAPPAAPPPAEPAPVEAAEPVAPAPEPAPEPEPEPVGVQGPGVESAAPASEIADAAPPAASTRQPSGFLDVAAVRQAAEDSGLDLPDSVYANVVAALASGKHLVISGPAGSGKTTLALAVAKAAVQAGRSAGAALATPSPKWSAHDTVGRVGDAGFSQGHVLAAAGRNKWLLIDELDRARVDKAFGDLSSFLGGLPLSLPDGSREVAAPKDWRIVATRDTSRGPLEASPALLRRFAQVHLPHPGRAQLERAIDEAADGDPTAAAAVKRLLAADGPGLGAGVFIDAARHAAERNAISPASEEELADECLAAYVTPHLRGDPHTGP